MHHYQQSCRRLLIMTHVHCQTSKFTFQHLYLLLARSFKRVTKYRILFEESKWPAERLSAVECSPVRQCKINCPFADYWYKTASNLLIAAIYNLPQAVHCTVNDTSSPGALRLAKWPVVIGMACGFIACRLRDNNFGGLLIEKYKLDKNWHILEINTLVFQNVTVSNFTDNY